MTTAEDPSVIPISEIDQLLKDMNWSETPLGPLKNWPPTLISMVETILRSQFPTYIVWGPERILIYNNAYIPLLGQLRHPLAFGRAFPVVWPEVAQDVESMFQQVDQGHSVLHENVKMQLHRMGYEEEAYFTFSISPLIDHEREIRGAVCICFETTDQVQARQELNETARDLIDNLESMSDAFFSIDANWTITRVNSQHEKLVQRSRDEQLGRNFLKVWFDDPKYEDSLYLKSYRKAMTERVPVIFEDYYDPLKFWTEVRVYPKSDGGIAVFFTDITERKATSLALVAAKEEAERANELKSAFLANMSHEIRTPLGAMMGFADLLKDPGLTATERQSFTNILSRNGESLSVIINDILDLSKVEAGHLTLEYTDTFPDQIGADVVSLLRVKANEKDLVLEYSHDETSPESVVADPNRVRQILLNLVGNAIKFTQFGSVKLRSFACKTERGRDALCFEISDTGIGIANDQHENIFEMFVQADGSMTRRFGGTGLGLALSRHLARSMGGDIVVSSSVEGVGSTFLVTIEDQPEKRLESSERISRTPTLSLELPERALDGIKILVVDDAPDNQQLIWRYLTKQGAIVESAENGILGYRSALTGSFDLVLMDIQMPVMDGYTATQKLREAGYRQPIIALTAHAMSEVRRKALNVGYSDHLTKPINPKELISTIAKHVRR